MEFFADLTFWQAVGTFLILIPVAIALIAALVFVTGWVFWIVIVIVFKLAVLAIAVAAFVALFMLFGGG